MQWYSNEQFGIVDKFNGQKDCKKNNKDSRKPDERFEEDGLRMIRAIRFSSKLGFSIDENTLKSIYKKMHI